MKNQHPTAILPRRLVRLYICFLALLSTPPPVTHGQIGASYHAITAYYNAYFLAKEDVKAIEKHLTDNEKRNYEELLPVLLPLDDELLKEKEESIVHCIKRTSYSIYKHPGSRWVYHAYLALGKARLFNKEYEDAVITLRYVNAKSDDPTLRQYAMMALARTYLEQDDWSSATQVIRYLDKEPIVRRPAQKDKLLLKAYMAQEEEDFPQMANYLEEALPLLRKSTEKIRLYFLLGQWYKRENQNEKAYEMFKQCMRRNPPYDTYLTAQLERMQVMPTSGDRGVKKMNRRYKRALSEKKNFDTKAKIYHAWGNSLYNQDLLEEAVEKFLLGIEESSKDAWQKINTLLRLGEIYYEDLGEYAASFPHYDSVVSLLPEEEKYEPIKKRHAILQRYTPHYKTIEEQDSLLSLAHMDKEALEIFLDEALAQKEAAFNKEARKKEATTYGGRSSGSGLFEEGQSIDVSGSGTGDHWYFYLAQAVSQGRSAFREQWGNRALQDNWRNEIATNKPTNTIAANPEKSSGDTQNRADTSLEQQVEEEGFTLTKESLRSGIPFSEAAQQQAHETIAEALFAIGTIYRFEMQKTEEAHRTFKRFLTDYPQHTKEAKVLYLLVVDDTLSEALRQVYKERLITTYPDSIYAKLAINPQYLVEEEQALYALKKKYGVAYRLYKQGAYAEAIAEMKKGLEENTGDSNPFVDNAKFLISLATAKLSFPYVYPMFLRNFLRKNPESELTKYVKTLLDAAEKKHQKTVVSSLPRYKKDSTEAPIIAWLYPAQEKDYVEKTLLGAIEEQLPQTHQAGHVLLASTYYVLIVRPAEKTDNRTSWYAALESNEELLTFQGRQGVSMFYISAENLTEMYLTRDHTLYLPFFKQKYKTDRAQ